MMLAKGIAQQFLDFTVRYLVATEGRTGGVAVKRDLSCTKAGTLISYSGRAFKFRLVCQDLRNVDYPFTNYTKNLIKLYPRRPETCPIPFDELVAAYCGDRLVNLMQLDNDGASQGVVRVTKLLVDGVITGHDEGGNSLFVIQPNDTEPKHNLWYAVIKYLRKKGYDVELLTSASDPINTKNQGRGRQRRLLIGTMGLSFCTST
jgi:hypothetical protein